jgi:hypothetical protein
VAEIHPGFETTLEVFDRHSVSFRRAAGSRLLGEVGLARGEHGEALVHLPWPCTMTPLRREAFSAEPSAAPSAPKRD